MPSATIGSRSDGCPARSTGRIAFVRSVTASGIFAGSILRSSSRTSTKTGVAPVCTTTFAVAGHVIGLVITSSPGPTPSATSERCNAAVPEATARACVAPTYSAKRRSSSAVRGPLVSQPDRSVSATASISSSPIAGGWNERSVLRLDESLCIGRDEAYALRGGRSARHGLVAARAHGEDRTGAVAPATQRREDVARLAVEPHPDDAVHRLRPVARL